MTLKQAKKICNNFAVKHKVIFAEDGEIGFMRPCVGFVKGQGYIDYNPRHDISEAEADAFFCKEFDQIKPEDAYHKHDCLAVLVHSKASEAIKQLAHWAQELDAIGIEVLPYRRVDTHYIHALLHGGGGYSIKRKGVENES